MEWQPANHSTIFKHDSSTRRSHGLVLVTALFTVLISVAICALAVLMPAPAPAVPLVVAICVGCPLFAVWDAPVALRAFRTERAGRTAAHALETLRRSLDQLPEVEHPLGL